MDNVILARNGYKSLRNRRSPNTNIAVGTPGKVIARRNLRGFTEILVKFEGHAFPRSLPLHAVRIDRRVQR